MNKKLIYFIENNTGKIILVIGVIMSLIARMKMLDAISPDMDFSLLSWFEEIKDCGGIKSLGKHIGNYNIPYVTIMTILTYLPFNPVHMIKWVSIFFDYAQAFALAMLIWDETKYERWKRGLIVLVALFSPVVILNSAYWGQCDSIYVTFLILTIYFLRKEKWAISFIMYGIAFAFKLQSIILLPFLLVYWVKAKKFNLAYFLLIPVTNCVLSLPAVIMGRDIKDILMIYVWQMSEYPAMGHGYPNFWEIIKMPYDFFSTYAIMLTMIILAFGAYHAIKKMDFCSTSNVFLWTIWSVWTCCMFLPSMHERYGYLVEIILLAYVVITKMDIPKLATLNIIILCAYGKFLFGSVPFAMPVLAVVNILIYCLFSIKVFTNGKTSLF